MADQDDVDRPAATPPTRRSIPPFEALRAFDAVARLGGVRKAAQGLRRNHAVISRHLRTIEEWTGTSLVERTAAGVILTEEGIQYHKKIGLAIDSIANATIDLMKLGVDNCISIWAMPGFAYQWIMPRLEEFEARNPNIMIALKPTQATPNYDRHDADIDIRFESIHGPNAPLPASCKSIKIAEPPTIAVASPGYLSSAPRVSEPKDLLKHQLIHEEDFSDWRAWLAVHGLDDEIDLTGMRLYHGHLTLDAARRGRGIALTNHLVAGDDLEAGTLVDIGAGNRLLAPRPLGVYQLVARADRWDIGPVKRFRIWLMHTLAE